MEAQGGARRSLVFDGIERQAVKARSRVKKAEAGAHCTNDHMLVTALTRGECAADPDLNK